MAGKLSMLRGRAKRVAAAAFASALTLFALTGTATPAVAETATPEITPEAKKWVDSNDDGTYTLNLSVTGKQESSSETVNQKADVILVMDVSTSMGKAETGNFGPEGDRLTYAKKAANQLVDELFSDETSSNVRVAVVPFGTIAKKRSSQATRQMQAQQSIRSRFKQADWAVLAIGLVAVQTGKPVWVTRAK